MIKFENTFKDGEFDCIRKLDEDTFRLHLWFEIPNCVIAVTNVILFFHILYLIYKNLRYPDQDIRSQGEFGTGGNDMLRLARGIFKLFIFSTSKIFQISAKADLNSWEFFIKFLFNKNYIIATLILVPLFGIHAFISLFVPSYEISADFGTKFYAEVILLILDSTSGDKGLMIMIALIISKYSIRIIKLVLFETLTGLVALVYCFGTREVQDELRRSWRSRPCLSDR